MKTTKSETRIEGTVPQSPTQEELRTALEVHTLAQMLYGQIAVTHPWVVYHEPWVQPYAAGPVAGWWR